MLKKSQLFKLALLQCKIITSVKYWGGGGGGGGGTIPLVYGLGT